MKHFFSTFLGLYLSFQAVFAQSYSASAFVELPGFSPERHGELLRNICASYQALECVRFYPNLNIARFEWNTSEAVDKKVLVTLLNRFGRPYRIKNDVLNDIIDRRHGSSVVFHRKSTQP